VLQWSIDGATLITVVVPPNTGRLYQYDGAFYVRGGTTTVPLSIEEIHAHLNHSGLAG
jgi:predicted HTH transcriptional regulator